MAPGKVYPDYNCFGRLFSALILFLFVAVCPVRSFAEASSLQPVTLHFPVTRDLALSSVGLEKNDNCGGKKKLKLKSQQELVLFDINPAALVRKRIKYARLHIRAADPLHSPLGRVSISSLSSPWEEGNVSWRCRPLAGTSCFSQAAYQQKDWSYTGSTVMDVVLGRGNSLWKFADCTPADAQGWQSCAIDPDVLAARVAGLSYGFCIYDDTGSTWALQRGVFTEDIFPNRTFYSHEKDGSGPWLEVGVQQEEVTTPPQPVSSMEVITEGLRPGEALVSWDVPEAVLPAGIIGFFVSYKREKDGEGGLFPRYLVPMAGKNDFRVKMHIQDMEFDPGERIELSVIAVDSSGNKSPPFKKEIRVAGLPEKISIFNGLKSYPPSTALPTVNGLKIAVVDLLDKINPVSGHMIPEHSTGYRGGNHLYSAQKRLIRLQAGRNETVSFQLNLEGVADDVQVLYQFDSGVDLNARVYLFNYVAAGSDSLRKGNLVLPDPLVPVPDTFSIPLKNNALAFAGQKNVSLICEAYVSHNVIAGDHTGKLIVRSGGKEISLDVALAVWNFTLPDRLSFVPEMNAYSTVSPKNGYSYYRLAHEHRTCINRVPYGWGGKPSFAPAWDGLNFDWSKWDKFVGPLLDGSAFNDLPRKNEPVDVLYLPFNENWPVNLFDHYSPSYWPEDAFDDKYRNQLDLAFSTFAQHCVDMGWQKTTFQFYLNNKLRYRKKDPKSSAPWLLDEPVDTKDFWALRWYGNVFHDAVRPFENSINMLFRTDVSYSQFGRNILWGVADIEYIGGNNDQKTRMKKDEAFFFKKTKFAEYGHPNKLKSANTQPVLWCLLAWSRGASGVLPWQTIGSSQSWHTGEQTALFYPHPKGPFPSIRLKAFTRGQQNIEYLTLMMDKYHIPFWQMADYVKAELGGLQSSVEKASTTDAGIANFRVIPPSLLWNFRYKLGQIISAEDLAFEKPLKQASKRKISFRDRSLPDLGLVKGQKKAPVMKPRCDAF